MVPKQFRCRPAPWTKERNFNHMWDTAQTRESTVRPQSNNRRSLADASSEGRAEGKKIPWISRPIEDDDLYYPLNVVAIADSGPRRDSVRFQIIWHLSGNTKKSSHTWDGLVSPWAGPRPPNAKDPQPGGHPRSDSQTKRARRARRSIPIAAGAVSRLNWWART